jgi:polyisoprenoid-binding protein YceI
MKLSTPAALASSVLVAIAISAGARTLADTPPPPAPDVAAPSLQLAGSKVRLVPAPTGNEARYRVREQLASIEFPSDAVGVTQGITGALVLEDGMVVKAESSFKVDVTTLKSDSQRRDGYVSRRTLETEQYPTVEFVPASISGLPATLPASGELKLQVKGDLTVHGVTKPATWEVTARAASGGYTGTATTAFKFADFGMAIPRVASVLSVVDSIRLEYDFNLVPETSGKRP